MEMVDCLKLQRSRVLTAMINLFVVIVVESANTQVRDESNISRVVSVITIVF